MSSGSPTDRISESQEFQEQQDLQGETRGSLREPLPPRHLSKGEFIEWALGQPSEEDWHTPLWNLTRLLKGWFKEGTKASMAWKEVRPVAKKLGGFEHLFLVEEDEAFDHFESAWVKIRYIAGYGPVDQAWEKVVAIGARFKAPGSEDRPASPKYDQFFALCGFLQLTVGEGVVMMLPVEDIAKRMKVDAARVSNWRQRAVRDGYLQEVTKHNWKARKATEFVMIEWVRKWFVERVAELTK